LNDSLNFVDPEQTAKGAPDYLKNVSIVCFPPLTPVEFVEHEIQRKIKTRLENMKNNKEGTESKPLFFFFSREEDQTNESGMYLYYLSEPITESHESKTSSIEPESVDPNEGFSSSISTAATPSSQQQQPFSRLISHKESKPQEPKTAQLKTEKMTETLSEELSPTIKHRRLKVRRSRRMQQQQQQQQQQLADELTKSKQHKVQKEDTFSSESTSDSDGMSHPSLVLSASLSLYKPAFIFTHHPLVGSP
jgi:hypothetical protein